MSGDERSPIRLGISTCPNDTFAFHALLTGEVRSSSLTFDVELADVQELNERMFAGRYDAAKVSFAAALAMAERVAVLPVGSALGFGVGPIVLGAPESHAPASPPRVLCPGEWTTATLLWRLFHPEPARLEQRVFSEIMPALMRGEADLGVCIHEGRFTWRESGLRLVEDLGATWENASGAPLPLGGIVARRDLAPEITAEVVRMVRASILWGREHPDACLATMRRYAQEHPGDVLRQHVDLYVTEATVDLGVEGRRALDALSAAARERGLLRADAPSLTIAEG